jgi:hypothetical protein
MLKGCALTYVVADGLHVLDHMRQGRHLATQVYVAGTLGIIAALIVLTLVLRQHPVAPLAAAVFGTLDAVAVLAVHFPPNWFFLSDSYQPLHLDALSWVSAAVVVAAAAALAVAGIRMLRWPAPQPV